MAERRRPDPDDTAVRVALWRALHVLADSPPHVFEDELGLELAAPAEGWRARGDMSPFTRPFRASIVARAHYIEELVMSRAAAGVGQYVILGAGLDTFVQRRPELASRLLREVATLAPGSTLVMSFMLPIELAEPEVRSAIERAAAGARANGTPFISFFTPKEMLALARDAGFRDVQHVSAEALAERYFAGRTDGLRPPNNCEELLVATT